MLPIKLSIILDLNSLKEHLQYKNESYVSLVQDIFSIYFLTGRLFFLLNSGMNFGLLKRKEFPNGC